MKSADRANRRKAGVTRNRRDWLPLVPLTLLVGLVVLYTTRVDALAALTIWPIWAWFLPAGLLLLMGVRRGRARNRLWVGLAWLAAWAAIGDEPLAITRAAVASSPSSSLRVVTLNCAGGNEEAAREAVNQPADVVLLQESPTQTALERIRRGLGKDWSLLAGVDGSILVHGRLTPVPLPRGTGDFVAAWARLRERSSEVLIVSLRLTPPVFRLDYWNPACWRDYAENRSIRRVEVRGIARFVASVKGQAPLILAGDFNTPPDPSVTSPLDPLARDTFRIAGRGWGATAVNDYPVVRIDQVWVSRGFEPVQVYAKKTMNSDHRLVVADLK